MYHQRGMLGRGPALSMIVAVVSLVVPSPSFGQPPQATPATRLGVTSQTVQKDALTTKRLELNRIQLADWESKLRKAQTPTERRKARYGVAYYTFLEGYLRRDQVKCGNALMLWEQNIAEMRDERTTSTDPTLYYLCLTGAMHARVEQLFRFSTKSSFEKDRALALRAVRAAKQVIPENHPSYRVVAETERAIEQMVTSQDLEKRRQEDRDRADAPRAAPTPACGCGCGDTRTTASARMTPMIAAPTAGAGATSGTVAGSCCTTGCVTTAAAGK